MGPLANRSFAAGSRQAPDPHDQFLEKEHYYRKHTPRDASSLFRCISEQLFDTQKYYKRVRDECVTYMLRNRTYFGSHIDGDFDDYMMTMSKLRTRATLLELRALAYCYNRNVVLFEPFTLGRHFIQMPGQDDTFQVFVTADYHFDSVYETSYIESAALCQSLIYEVLYKDVFKLPDVEYAVERMLHDGPGDSIKVVTIEPQQQQQPPKHQVPTKSKKGRFGGRKAFEDAASPTITTVAASPLTKAITEDGREFLFDNCDATSCILEDYRLCHFHNQNFDQMLATFQDADLVESNGNNQAMVPYNEPANTNANDSDQCQKRYRYAGSLLRDKTMSCVYQLLHEGITPFPYKVAKALDPYIYRNIEFDVWNEIRKETRLRYSMRRFLQVGDKCLVRNKASGHDSRGGGGNKMYVGHIQHIEKYSGLYHVFIEELGHQLVVTGEALRLFDDCHRQWPAYKYHQQRAVATRGYSYQRPHFNRRHRQFADGGCGGVERGGGGDGGAADSNVDIADLKKNTLGMVVDKTTTVLFNDDAYLKELLQPITMDPSKLFCSSYFDQYSKLFVPDFAATTYTNDIVAMPAFVSSEPPNAGNEAPHQHSSANDKHLSGNVTADAVAEYEHQQQPQLQEQLTTEAGYGNAYGSSQLMYGAPMQMQPAQQCYPINRNGTWYYDGLPQARGIMVLPQVPAQSPAYMPSVLMSSQQPYYMPQQTPQPVYVQAQQQPYYMPQQAMYMPQQQQWQPNNGCPGSPYPMELHNRELLQSGAPVNVNLTPSFFMDGSDLPVNDLNSLRFFYNLGHEWFAQVAMGSGGVHAAATLFQTDSTIQQYVMPAVPNESSIIAPVDTVAGATAASAVDATSISSTTSRNYPPSPPLSTTGGSGGGGGGIVGAGNSQVAGHTSNAAAASPSGGASGGHNMQAEFMGNAKNVSGHNSSYVANRRSSSGYSKTYSRIANNAGNASNTTTSYHRSSSRPPGTANNGSTSGPHNNAKGRDEQKGSGSRVDCGPNNQNYHHQHSNAFGNNHYNNRRGNDYGRYGNRNYNNNNNNYGGSSGHRRPDAGRGPSPARPGNNSASNSQASASQQGHAKADGQPPTPAEPSTDSYDYAGYAPHQPHPLQQNNQLMVPQSGMMPTGASNNASSSSLLSYNQPYYYAAYCPMEMYSEGATGPAAAAMNLGQYVTYVGGTMPMPNTHPMGGGQAAPTSAAGPSTFYQSPMINDTGTANSSTVPSSSVTPPSNGAVAPSSAWSSFTSQTADLGTGISWSTLGSTPPRGMPNLSNNSGPFSGSGDSGCNLSINGLSIGQQPNQQHQQQQAVAYTYPPPSTPFQYCLPPQQPNGAMNVANSTTSPNYPGRLPLHSPKPLKPDPK